MSIGSVIVEPYHQASAHMSKYEFAHLLAAIAREIDLKVGEVAAERDAVRRQALEGTLAMARFCVMITEQLLEAEK